MAVRTARGSGLSVAPERRRSQKLLGHRAPGLGDVVSVRDAIGTREEVTMKQDLAQYTADEFDLDVRIVEFGPVAAALLADTDDGCDTRKDGDC
jgi:FxLD family lantipeptide